ncbi:prolipoprotein diacylglyceryl transferase [Gallalistipes aquisgranensis]|uniref:prolipoprotein diacylglyceryl transferase n=1 Tax=Gallalistipes aquisgranensis TaxID=2779358 RepID=UPI001CF83D76|nr:prolipoprotein diacylglyceryl transferase [Gallalistipes aquisgranensis]MBE5034656.1 prolipoprotein diacylglyceryl transferase [Gallalistipes aquisgranensis]
MGNLFLTVMWNFDPVFFRIGSVEIRYYGVMWAVAFAISMWLFINFVKREGYPDKVFDSIFWFGTLSTIIGARLGHCLFYETDYYLSNPVQILNIRQGGLASHGAAIGLLVGLWLFSRRNRMPYLWSLDRIMVAVAISGVFVRLGNLFNSEIYGIETASPWGFVFLRAGETVPKHPTQIYEALCYLATFFVLLWLYYGRDLARRRPGFMFGLGVFLIFVSRFFIEYIKNPQEEFELNMSLLMGQWLSIPFILLGIVMMVWALRRPVLEPEPLDRIRERVEGENRKTAAKKRR